jgi:putative ABC transport system permease protein
LFISIVTGILFGLVPAMQAARSSRGSSLREGSRGSGSSKHQMKISRIFVSFEIALSLVLLIGAGLLLQSFWRLLKVRPGFDSHGVITAQLWLPVPNDPSADPYGPIEKRSAFLQEVLRRVRAIPGVEDAALGSPSSLPMSAARTQLPFVIASRAAETDRPPVAEFTSASPEYFHVLRIPLMRGRAFTEADAVKGQFVALINETLARNFWPGEDAIGQTIKVSFSRFKDVPVTIVGVVADVRSDGFDAASAPHVYLSSYQNPGYASVVYVRSAVDPGTLGDAIRREVQMVNSGVPVFSVGTIDEVVSKSLAERRFVLEILGLFAGIAVLLASIGIYGVMAYTFSQRTREIGIRMALGAQRRDILRLALGEGALLVVFGVIAGLLGSLVLTRLLQSMLFNVTSTDPATFAAIAALLAAIALLACYIPAQRATQVAPIAALRSD